MSKGNHLAELKMKESQRNEKSLLAALDRFKSRRLQIVPKGSKLTRLNLAIEAGLSRDTAFSRFRQGHEKAGQYRFPKVTKLFFALREKRNTKPNDLKHRTETNELKARIGELERSLASSRSVANALDAEVDNGKIRIKDLEELSSNLAEENDALKIEIVKLRKQRMK